MLVVPLALGVPALVAAASLDVGKTVNRTRPPAPKLSASTLESVQTSSSSRRSTSAESPKAAVDPELPSCTATAWPENPVQVVDHTSRVLAVSGRQRTELATPSLAARTAAARAGARIEALVLRTADGQLCAVPLIEHRSGAAVSSATPPAPTTEEPVPLESTGGVSLTDFAENVRPLGNGEFQVRRDFLQAILRSGGEHLTSTEALPEHMGGRLMGVRIGGLHPGGLLQSLGLLDGDLLRSLDGRIPLSLQDVFDRFQELEVGDELTLSMERNGDDVSLRFRMQ